jgi:cytochrome c553
MRHTLRHIGLCVLLMACTLAQGSDMADRTKPCEACHGSQGRAGPDGYYPRLAGKPSGYLYNQMQNFSHGRRHYTMMRRMMEPLSPSYQMEMADYFANLQVPYLPAAISSAKPTREQVSRGKQLAMQGDPSLDLPACVSCHGDNLMGAAPNVPGLLGLPAAYLGAQLSAWAMGNRRTQAPDCMHTIAKKLPASDAAAVTAWLAAQDVRNQKITTQAPQAPSNLRCGSAPELHKGRL